MFFYIICKYYSKYVEYWAFRTDRILLLAALYLANCLCIPSYKLRLKLWAQVIKYGSFPSSPPQKKKHQNLLFSCCSVVEILLALSS